MIEIDKFIYMDKESHKKSLIVLAFFIIILLLIGMFFFHFTEGWSYIDSLYFSAISLSTRGYGELFPTLWYTKLFVVFYLFLGVSFILYALSSFLGFFIQYEEPGIEQKFDAIINKFSKRKKEEADNKWVVIKTKSKK